MLAIHSARVNLRNNIRSIIVRVKLFLAMTNPDIYTCDGAGLVVIRSLMTALCLSKKKKKKKKKEDEQFAWAAISVYHFRNVCQLRQRYFLAQNNRLINPRCLESRETL